MLALANTGQAPPAWLALFPVFFVFMWFAVTTLLGYLGGHHTLLARFPPVDERCEPSFPLASGTMGWVRSNGALFVGFGQRGLHLAPNWLFRPILQRGIPCIPWHELRVVSGGPGGIMGLFTGATFEVPSVDVKFTLHGAPGRALAQRLAAKSP